MSATVIPPDILPDVPETIELVDDQTFVFEPAFSRGFTQRASFGDPRWRIRRRYTALRERDRTRLLRALNEARGAHTVVYLSPAQERLGSFPSTELFSNADFSQGVTNWSATGALSASNGILRVTREKNAVTASEIVQSVGLSPQYGAFALRALAVAPSWPSSNYIGVAINDGVVQTTDYQTERGMRTAAQVALSTSSISQYPVVANNAGVVPGHYVDLLFTSLARCALVDNGPNRLLYSDAIDNAAWTKNALTVTTGAVAPDDTTSAVTLTPTTVNTTHYAGQSATVSSSAADFSFSCAVRANGYNYVRLQLSHSAGDALQVFNLSTGALGATSSVGTGWAYLRAFIAPLGDSWYYCSIVARKLNAETTIYGYIVVQNSDSTANFAGDGSSGIRAFRATLAQSSAPTRLIETTSSAIANGTAQTGGALYLKALPASTSGLLLPGDWVEINGQLKMVTASLDSNAAGLGLLQVRPGVHRGASDNDPVIVTKPMGRFLLRNSARWDNRYGHYLDGELVFDEVYT